VASISNISPLRPESIPKHECISPPNLVPPASPVERSVSPGPPLYRSGKITLHSDGPSSTHYNTVLNLNSFWMTPPLWRPSSPVSVAAIDLTSDNEDPLDSNDCTPSLDSSTPELSTTTTGSSQARINTGGDLLSRAGSSLGSESILIGHLRSPLKPGQGKARRLIALYKDDDVANVSIHGFIDRVDIKLVK
jgi:hypothetical protein